MKNVTPQCTIRNLSSKKLKIVIKVVDDSPIEMKDIEVIFNGHGNWALDLVESTSNIMMPGQQNVRDDRF